MKVSDRGIFALALHEGIVPAPYLDSVNVWTWGIGHTASAGSPNPANMEKGVPDNLTNTLKEVFEVFKRDLAKFEERVNRAVKVPLEQHEFDALVSFDFNTGGIHRAKLTEHLNNGDKAAAARAFMGWLRPPEIRSRRESEMILFRDGTYPSGSVAVFGVTPSNKPDFRQVLKRMNQAEVLSYMRTKERTSPVQSTTVQASAAQIAAGASTGVAGVAMLDGTAQIVLLVLGAVIVVAGLWIFRERIKYWKAGIK